MQGDTEILPDGERLSQFHLINVRYLGQRFGGSSTAFPSMFYRVTTAHRELTLLDDFVDVSPLTIRGTQVRGIHLHDHALEIHAGYAAATMYEDLFLPADRRWVAGVGYGVDRGGIRWTPSLYGFFSQPGNSTARCRRGACRRIRPQGRPHGSRRSRFQRRSRRIG